MVLLAATALSACGGGDGDQSSQPVTTSGAPSTPEPSPPKPTNVMTPACSDCGAVDADTYAGTVASGKASMPLQTLWICQFAFRD
jgi:hypothetical protein